MSTFQMLRITYPFVILRFLVLMLTVLPIVWIVPFYINFLTDFLGVRDTPSLFRDVASVAFGYIGFLVGWVILSFFRKTLLFYVKIAHVIAITKLCVEDAPVRVTTDSKGNVIDEKIMSWALVGEGIKEMMKKFLTVNLFFAANGLVNKGLRSIEELILRQDIMPFLKRRNIITRFLGGTIKTTLSFSDEIVLSYVWFRCRLNELYGGSEGSKKKGKKASFTEMLGYVVEGLCLYIKATPGLMKAAFITVLSATIFGMITTVITIIIIVYASGFNMWVIIVTFALVRLIFLLLSYVLMEPYETCALIGKFYDAISEEKESGDTSAVKAKLVAMSGPFKKLFNRASGESVSDLDDVDEVVTSGESSVFDENLMDLAREGAGDVLIEDDDEYDDEYEGGE